MNKMILTFLSLLTTAWAEPLTPYSGTLPRPILMVHGVFANMSTWAVKPLHKRCEEPNATFVRPLYGIADRNVFGTMLNRPRHVYPTGPTAPIPKFEKYMDWERSLPEINYWNAEPITSGGLMKTSADFFKDALPPLPAGTNLHDYLDFVPVLIGSEWNVACKDGSFHNYKSNLPIFLDTPEFRETINVHWFMRAYEIPSISWKNGLVESYETGSTPWKIQQRYELKNWSKINGFDGSYGINHNGLEFYTAMTPDYEHLDPFAYYGKTDGPKADPARNNRLQLGQTNQFVRRLTDVLDEYYPDWKTNNNRKIDIVCHSQGGLLLRSALASERTLTTPENPLNHINHIITVGTPHLGTAHATDYGGIPTLWKYRKTILDFYNGGGTTLLKGVCVVGSLVDDLTKIYGGMTMDPTSALSAVSDVYDVYSGVAGLVDASSLEETCFSPLQAVEELAMNFTGTDITLAYPDAHSVDGWVPSLSNIGQTGICLEPAVSTVKKVVTADPDGSNVSEIRYEFRVTCQNGFSARSFRYTQDVSSATYPYLKKFAAKTETQLKEEVRAEWSGLEYSQRSADITKLRNHGFPTLPRGGQVPLTAIYSSAPQMAVKMADYIYDTGREFCNDHLLENAVKLKFGSVAACYSLIQLTHMVFSKDVDNLDSEWSKYSDFIVDQSSQQGKGVFDEKRHPFRLVNLTPSGVTIPHLNLPGYKGEAWMAGDKIIESLDNPPKRKPVNPAILGLLLQ